MNLAYANGALFLLVLIELFILFFLKKEHIPWREVIFNLNSGHILMWVLRGAEVAIYYYVVTHWSLGLFDNWNHIILWILSFIVWDFCFYWLHRMHHKYPLLWAVHIVHHEGAAYNLSLGIRNSWYSSITSIPFFIGLAFIGVPFEIFMAVSGIHYFVQFYNHNKLIRKSGVLEYIMVTPSHHRVHHGTNPEYIHHNFGGTLVFWDKLFGTFQKELDDVSVNFGVMGYEQTDDVVIANNLPLRKLLNLQTKGVSRNSSMVPDSVVVTAGLVLFSMLLYYIYQENVWPFHLKAILFLIIFLGTVANGAFSDGKKWGVWLWGCLFWGIGPLFLVSQQLSEPILLFMFVVMALHALWLFISVRPKFD